MARNRLFDKAPGKPENSICRENKVDGTVVPLGNYIKLLFIGWEDASSTPSILGAVARGDYRSGDALDKLGPFPARAPNES